MSGSCWRAGTTAGSAGRTSRWEGPGWPAPGGGVGQPRVAGGHPRRVVIEDLLHDVLGNVPVDQPGAQSMAPLVRGQVHRPAVFVADLTSFQPAAECSAV